MTKKIASIKLDTGYELQKKEEKKDKEQTAKVSKRKVNESCKQNIGNSCEEEGERK